jgi:hypothetical protein
MKKTALLLLALFLIMVMPVSVLAAGSASFSLKVSATQIRINDTITVTGSLSASESVATFDLTVTYPAANLQYIKAEGLSAIKAGEMDINHSTGKIQFLYLDADGGGSGITSAGIFRITFKVISGSVGDSVSVGISIKTVGNKDAQAMSSSGSGAKMTVSAPLSTNTNLSSLSVSSGTLSPAFSAATTSYNLTVPYDVSKLSVTAKVADASAKASINSPTLTPGGTTKVTVNVTAASGSEKVYTINVKRDQDPNYVPSNNNNLTSLIVEGFLLSPGFDTAKDEYAIYLPYEVSSIDVTALAEDDKATIAIAGATDIKTDVNNLVNVVCTAEDGSEKTYTIVAIRAAAFTGLNSLTPTPTPTSPPPTPEPTPTVAVTTTTAQTVSTTTMSTTTETNPNNPNGSNDPSDIGRIILIAVLATIILAETLYIIYKHNKEATK